MTIKHLLLVLTGSWRKSKTKFTISFRIPSICWWHPSPMADKAINPACRYFQSAVRELNNSDWILILTLILEDSLKKYFYL